MHRVYCDVRSTQSKERWYLVTRIMWALLGILRPKAINLPCHNMHTTWVLCPFPSSSNHLLLQETTFSRNVSTQSTHTHLIKTTRWPNMSAFATKTDTNKTHSIELSLYRNKRVVFRYRHPQLPVMDDNYKLYIVYLFNFRQKNCATLHVWTLISFPLTVT